MEDETLSRGTILVVDDTPASVGMLQSALEQENYDVLIATSGEKALERVELILPDLILLDIMMPGIDGYETCLQLKSNPFTHDIPVIFLSALSETFDKVRAFSIGGVDYLTKPVEPEELLIRVKTHIRVNHLEKELINTNRDLEKRVEVRTKELIKANETLQERENLFKSIFDTSPIAICHCDHDGKIGIVNPAFISVFGLNTSSDIIGHNLFHDPNIHHNMIQKIRSEQRYQTEILYDFSIIHKKKVYKTKKNGSHYFLCTFSHISQTQEILNSGFITFIEDITEKKTWEHLKT